MHGCNSGSALLVNAEVDSMGGIVDGGVGIGVKTSPRRAAIERAQAELRKEYDVREERRRELDFLEKGGNPLDFKFGNAASVSVQSTSLTDQQAEHFVTSEAKGSFALTASPHGDSVESRGRPGIPAVCEPISADNLLFFHGENESHEGETKSMHPRKRNTVVPSVQSSQRDGAQNTEGSEDSAIFRPYARRNRSKINRDGARSNSTEMVQGRGGHVSSLPAHGLSKDDKDLTSEANNQKDKNMPPVNTRKSATSNGDLASKVITSDNQLNMELDGGQAANATTDQSKGDLSKSKVDVTVPNEAVQVESHKSPVNVSSEEPDLVGGKEQVVSTGSECPPGTNATKAENETIFNKLNGVGDGKRDEKDKPLDGKNSSATRGVKGLDSESSCTENSLSLDVNNDNGVSINPKNVDSKGNPTEQTSKKEESLNLAVGDLSKENNERLAVDNVAIICDTNTSLNQNHSLNNSMVKVEEEIRSELQNEVNCPSSCEVQQSSHPVAEAEGKTSTVQGDNSNSKSENISTSRPLHTKGNFIFEIPKRTSLEITSTTNTDVQTGWDNHVKVVDEAHEDSILEEARIIEAKRKRIAELSAGTLPLANQQKSHWDFVLEEMAWLANDFAQERLWKMTAAAQLCRRAAFTSQLKFEEQNQFWKLKGVALTLANSVMEFWHSAEMLLNSKDRSLGPKNSGHDLVRSRANDVTENENAELDMGMNKEDPRKVNDLAIRAYALRFLKYSSSPVPALQAEEPAKPDRISDAGIIDIPWNEHLTEESLFYSVPSGAMETYRRSIESYLVQNEKTWSTAQEEVEASAYDDGAEFGYGDFLCDEDEGETSTYYLPGAFEDRKSSKQSKKKRKNLMKSFPARQYETGADLPYGNCAQQSMLIGKRPGSSLNVGSIPTKRVRTGSRQRVLSPFSSAAAVGGLQAPTKTDASSGDTNSFQDDQSTLQGGFQIQKGMEVESTGDFDRQQPYDYAETPTKPIKKKKAKNLGSAYDQGWQLESTIQNEQRDYSKKRSESHHFDSNGSSVLFGQHIAKKLKVMKQQPDNAFDINPSGSIPSPVGSQMSNMSNPNRIIRLINGRDRGRKAKTPKMSAGEPGSGCPWSLFEDQALVVLVHDMGPNWELVSDAINSTLQFKCIFRKPKECKERHKILMDRSGDGADSADDLGSSQSYPSTLPGIPKGSARQLFQRLQGPMEEDTLKSHFEKIILIGKKQHYRWSKDSKQIVPVHNSHVIALSQVCPNNLNGGVLTPLDLCDVTASSQDVLPLGYQASHTSGLAISNQGSAGSIPPASGANSSLKGSSGMVLGNNLASLSTPLNASVRDGRYGVPRTSLPADEQHRMQQYNQLLSGRNIQQSNLSLPGAVSGSDCMVRMLPGGNNLGMMGRINRGMSLSRPGFQGMTSSAVLNSGSMLSSNLVGMPSPVNMHSGPGSGQGNSMLRQRDTKHMMRPGNSPEPQRQLMVPELQMQTQGNSQGIPPFNGLNSAYPNQSTTPSVKSYPGHPQQQQQMPSQQSHALRNSHHSQHQGSNHATGPQQQAYAMRLAKERQMQQQRLMQQQQPQKQQQQQFAASSALMPQVQPPTQLPISSSLQNSSQIQSQAATQPVSLPPPSSPLTPMSLQHQQKHHLAPHGLGRNPQTGASGLNNQVGKQQQWQPQQQQQQYQQCGRQHPQQRQQTQSQQQTELLKGVGRGNVPVHQNLSTDPADLSGLCMASSNQTAEKGEQITNLMQGQGLYPGPGTNPVQQSKPLVSQPQQKQFSGATPPSTKQLQQMVSHTVPSGHTPSAVNQCILPAAMGPNPQHLHLPSQPHQNQNQSTVQRVLQQNRPVNSDPPSKSQAEPTQADQQQMNNSSQMGTTTTTAVSQSGIDSANNTVQNLSSVGSQWKASEPVYNPGMPIVATQMGSVGSPPLTNSAVSVPVPAVSQGIAHKQSSGGLPPHGNKAGTQRPQQPQIQQSPTPAPSQQHYQPQEQLQHDLHNSPPQQLPLHQQSQQQTPQLQAIQGNLYHRPSSSKLE
ncbi:Detected protein of confused Function [Hibiscus syriacus]|uniref:Detected protein of confused Function n=1 Tax=Hibiscus syriacus TaxID=106335 RepID=A0A6A2ZKP1_HIBSY|nr:chromatin modification-related protein EAF1 B-like [Hibiscus syriacus]KAE8692146.1 Detected protein of confused Function [Hibiscus syriacus]